MKQSLFRAIGLRCGFLSGGSDDSGLFEQPPFEIDRTGQRLVVGNRAPGPDDGPPSKFDALFDTNPIYDEVRFSFVNTIPQENFERILGEELETLCNGLSDAECADFLTQFKEPVVEPMCELLRELCRRKPAPDYSQAERAWRSYLRCWEEPDYWFSIDDLLFLCILADVHVKIFEAHEGLLEWRQEHIVPEKDRVSIVIKNDRASGPVRGHVERMVLATDSSSAIDDGRESQSEIDDDMGYVTSMSDSTTDEESSSSASDMLCLPCGTALEDVDDVKTAATSGE